jgi:hypothetical protein
MENQMTKNQKAEPYSITEMVSTSMKSTIERYEYGWVYKEELDQLVKDATGNENAVAEEIYYAIGNNHITRLVTEDYQAISKNTSEKGYPIKFYDKDTNELLGFVFIGEDEIKEIISMEDKSDLSDFYSATVNTQEEDINFQFMLMKM